MEVASHRLVPSRLLLHCLALSPGGTVTLLSSLLWGGCSSCPVMARRVLLPRRGTRSMRVAGSAAGSSLRSRGPGHLQRAGHREMVAALAPA